MIGGNNHQGLISAGVDLMNLEMAAHGLMTDQLSDMSSGAGLCMGGWLIDEPGKEQYQDCPLDSKSLHHSFPIIYHTLHQLLPSMPYVESSSTDLFGNLIPRGEGASCSSSTK